MQTSEKKLQNAKGNCAIDSKWLYKDGIFAGAGFQRFLEQNTSEYGRDWFGGWGRYI